MRHLEFLFIYNFSVSPWDGECMASSFPADACVPGPVTSHWHKQLLKNLFQKFHTSPSCSPDDLASHLTKYPTGILPNTPSPPPASLHQRPDHAWPICAHIPHHTIGHTRSHLFLLLSNTTWSSASVLPLLECFHQHSIEISFFSPLKRQKCRLISFLPPTSTPLPFCLQKKLLKFSNTFLYNYSLSCSALTGPPWSHW